VGVLLNSLRQLKPRTRRLSEGTSRLRVFGVNRLPSVFDQSPPTKPKIAFTNAAVVHAVIRNSIPPKAKAKLSLSHERDCVMERAGQP
jgi:hypothetical protein